MDISENRNVTATFHFEEACKWLVLSQEGHRTTPLVYSAFEFRLTLERVAFDLLYQIRGSSFDESDFKAAKNIKNIQNRVHELEGHQLQLDRKFTFLRIVLKLAGNNRIKLASVNLSILKKHWHFCSDFCHMYLSLSNSWGDKSYVDAVFKGLCEVRDSLKEIIESLIVWPRWEDPWIKNLLDDFVAGNSDAAAVEIELKKKGVWGTYEAPDGTKTFLSDL